MQLITTKPTIYLVNLTMKDYLRQKSKYLPLIAKWVTEHGGTPRDIIPFSIEFEEKLHSLKEDTDKLTEFLKEIKVKSKLEKIITEGFTKLGLYYYFTAGEKEIRCWTIQKGCLAPQAGTTLFTSTFTVTFPSFFLLVYFRLYPSKSRSETQQKTQSH